MIPFEVRDVTQDAGFSPVISRGKGPVKKHGAGANKQSLMTSEIIFIDTLFRSPGIIRGVYFSANH